ncbi:MAG: metalloprotease TldD, partial [Burkholderiales bacterium]
MSAMPLAASGDDSLALAEALLLAPYGLGLEQLDRTLAAIHSHRVDYADLYFQYSRAESWTLEEGQVKSGSFHIDQGVGVRAVAGERTAFAYSDDISAAALASAAMATRAIAGQGQSGVAAVSPRPRKRMLYPLANPLPVLADADKVALLERLEKLARARDPRITQVIASLAAEHEVILVAASDGRLVADVRPLVRVSVQVIAEQNGRREQGHAGGGGRGDYRYFT